MTQAPSPPLVHPEDPDDEWVTTVNPGRTLRVRALTAGLVVLAVLGGGFWAGVVAEKHHGNGSTSPLASLAGRFAAARAGAGGGAGGLTGSGSLAAGTVVDVQGDILDITDTNGNLVKVQVGPSTTITRTGSSPLSGLKIGDTVVVAGSRGSGGTVSATSVRATAQGVTGGGGFGRFPGAGGAGG